MNLHYFTTADLPDVLALNQNAIPLVNSLTTQKLSWLVEISARSRVAKIDGNVTGFLIALSPEADYPSPYFHWFRQRYAAFLYIDRIVVAEHARRSGIGLALLSDAQAFAFACGQLLASDLYEDNRESLAFHHKFGFEQVGRQQTGPQPVLKLLKRPVA